MSCTIEPDKKWAKEEMKSLAKHNFGKTKDYKDNLENALQEMLENYKANIESDLRDVKEELLKE